MDRPVSGGGMGVIGVSCGGGKFSQTFCARGGRGVADADRVGETVTDGVREYVADGVPEETGSGAGVRRGVVNTQAARMPSPRSGRVRINQRAAFCRVSNVDERIGLIIAADYKNGGTRSGRSGQARDASGRLRRAYPAGGSSPADRA